MKRIHVKASHEYDVIVGSNIIAGIAKYLPNVKEGTTAAIISDSNVWPIYGQKLSVALSEAGLNVIHFTFTAGEASKNIDTYLSILNFLAKNHMTRSDLLLALGGGVVGDITGFAAATYLRGISYVQIPTSLLAMVDSSVGGKTAIDLPAGKNLVGAFYQPTLVLCDVSSLETLTGYYFIDGCAEVIKYGILYDEKLFAHLENEGLHFDRQYVISRCIELKRDVVLEDEFDTGARQKLNLGHTIGHSIEAQSNFSISHGRGVAIGTNIITKVSVACGICDVQTHKRIKSLLEAFSLPVETSLSAEQLTTYALSDKKRFGSHVNLIMPERIGHCIIHQIPIDIFKSTIQAGL